MHYSTSALLACLLNWPFLIQSATITAYNDANCNPQNGQGLLMNCPNMLPGQCCPFPVIQGPLTLRSGQMRPTWITVGSVGFYGVGNLDDTHWREGPTSGCNGNDVPTAQYRGVNRCHSRNIGTGQWKWKAADNQGTFVGGGGIYFTPPPQQPGPGQVSGIDAAGLRPFVANPGNYIPQSGGRPWRRRRRDDVLKRADPNQCPANASAPGECEQAEKVYYGWPEDRDNDKGVWILDPLPKDKQAAFEAEILKKPWLDVLKDFGARYVADPMDDPVLEQIMTAHPGDGPK